MNGSANSTCLGSECGGRNALIRPEGAELTRLAGLVGRVFHAPVAYAAMLGHRDRVMSRVGIGEAHWKYMKMLPLGPFTAAPMAIRDVREGLPGGATLGELRFLATAPIRTFCGQHLGLLVIADEVPRPEFSEQELSTLADLAGIVAVGIELRMVASQSMESRLRYDEAEERFRAVANGAQTLIACNNADGSCAFVNDAWLKFTGRYIKDELGDGWQQAIHDPHQQRVLNLYWQALQIRQAFTVEVPLRRHDGVVRWMQGTGTPRFLKDRNFAGFVVCLTDVCDWSEAAAERAEAAACAISEGPEGPASESCPQLVAL